MFGQPKPLITQPQTPSFSQKNLGRACEDERNLGKGRFCITHSRVSKAEVNFVSRMGPLTESLSLRNF